MPVGPFSVGASSFSKFRRRYPEIEASNSQPGKYKFVVKNRKGFVKVALRNGLPPLVPAVSFGETDLFDQLVQEFIRKSLGVASVIIYGRGFFQCSFGIIPRKQPITTVGKIFVSTQVVLL
jgi:2-acylglycerol O-acyltransferase 2